MVEGLQTHMDVCRCTWMYTDARRQMHTHADERKANCVWWGGQMQPPDDRRLVQGLSGHTICAAALPLHLPSILQMGHNTESQTSQTWRW